MYLTKDSRLRAELLPAMYPQLDRWREVRATLDPRHVLWKRALDVNDRALRRIVVGLGGPAQGVPRESGFDITAASEIMNEATSESWHACLVVASPAPRMRDEDRPCCASVAVRSGRTSTP